MTRLDLTTWIFLVFFAPSLALWLFAAGHDLVEVLVRRWRS